MAHKGKKTTRNQKKQRKNPKRGKTPVAARKSSSTKKNSSSGLLGQIILSVALMLLMLAYFQLPTLKAWHQQRFKRYYQYIPQQRQAMTIEQRTQSRHAGIYQLVKYLESTMKPDEVFLTPPRRFCTDNKMQATISYPHGIYYFSNKIKTRKYDQSSFGDATYALSYEGKKLQVADIREKEVYDRIMAEYAKYQK